jgi:hypothetical protein
LRRRALSSYQKALFALRGHKDHPFLKYKSKTGVHGEGPESLLSVENIAHEVQEVLYWKRGHPDLNLF